MADIPNNVRNARLLASMRQQDLADKIGLSQQQVDKIEHGQRTLDFPTAIRIAKATGVTLDELAKEEKS